jgi:hypothetical protein
MTDQTETQSITELTTILIDDQYAVIDLEGFIAYESVKRFAESCVKRPITWDDDLKIGLTDDGHKISFSYQEIIGKATISDYQSLALLILLTVDQIERQSKDTMVINMPSPFVCEDVEGLTSWMMRFCARVDALRHLMTTDKFNATLGPQGEADWKRLCEKTLEIAGAKALEIPALWKRRFIIAHQAFVLEETPIPDDDLIYQNLASFLKPEESQTQPANAA